MSSGGKWAEEPPPPSPPSAPSLPQEAGQCSSPSPPTARADADAPNATAGPAATARAVRHAEKRRTATCAFADRVARISLDRYRSAVPAGFREEQPQTCVAAVVAQFRRANKPREADAVIIHDGQAIEEGALETPSPLRTRGEEEVEPGSEDELEVVALGVGTKFLNEDALSSLSSPRREGPRDPPPPPGPACALAAAEEAATAPSRSEARYGDRVRDCHAEVLARRAFRRHLSLEILRDLQGCEVEGGGSLPGPQGLRQSLLERVPSGAEAACGEGADRSLVPRYRLRPGVTLHLYCSSAPCGNAVLKKFCTVKREAFRGDLPDHEWPAAAHPPMVPGHSRELGQFVLLCKRDSSSHDPVAARPPTPLSGAPLLLRGREAAWPCHQTDGWCPPGTTTVATGTGSLHTCSDKIALWNVLGLQGSLLAPFLERPLYLSTVVVGRKFASVTCRRALCCRLGNQEARSAETSSAASKDASSSPRRKREIESGFLPSSPYRLQHPAVLGTGVYMDERGVIDMSEARAAGNDVRFHSSKSWAWWPGLKDAECIDGSTGMLLSRQNSFPGRMDPNSTSVDPGPSLVSTTTLVHLACQIRELAVSEATASNHLGAERAINSSSLATRVDPAVNLQTLQLFKQELSPEYEQAKEVLLTRHPVLRFWKRRSTKYKNGKLDSKEYIAGCAQAFYTQYI